MEDYEYMEPTDETKRLIRPIIRTAGLDVELRLRNIIRFYVQNFIPEEKRFLWVRWVPKARQREIFETTLKPGFLLEMFREYFRWLFALNSPPMVDMDNDDGVSPIAGNGIYMANDSANGDITINDERLDDKYEFVKSLAHEMWHDFQKECDVGVIQNSTQERREYGDAMRRSFGSVVSPTFVNPGAPTETEMAVYHEYQKQAHEVDARYFSREFMKVFKKKFKDQARIEREHLREAEREERRRWRDYRRRV